MPKSKIHIDPNGFKCNGCSTPTLLTNAHTCILCGMVFCFDCVHPLDDSLFHADGDPYQGMVGCVCYDCSVMCDFCEKSIPRETKHECLACSGPVCLRDGVATASGLACPQCACEDCGSLFGVDHGEDRCSGGGEKAWEIDEPEVVDVHA